MQEYEIMKFIIADICIIATLLGMTLFPLKFNLSIIPEIEKKLGKKIRFTVTVGLPLGRYLRFMEVSSYITTTYIKKLRGKSLKPLAERKCQWALSKADYHVEDFSRREVIWSFAAMINIIVWVGCGGLLLLLN